MKNIKMIILGLTAFLIACGGGGSGSSSSGGSVAADIDGLDLTGVWRFVGIRCTDPTLQTITAEGTPSSNSSVGTIVIQGNQYTSEDLGSSLGSGSCKVSISRSIVANLVDGDASGGIGTGTFGATSATVAPTSTCSLFYSFNMNFGNVTPSTLAETYTNAQPIPQQAFEFLISLPIIGITTLMQVVGRPTDICFWLYQKL